MSKIYDVIIAGAGPVGLFLACELGLARLSVLILERELTPETPWKDDPFCLRSLNTSVVETFYRRGLLSQFFNHDEQPSSLQKKPGFQPGGHFGGIMLDANKFDLDRWKYRLPGPALIPPIGTKIDRIETILTERAESLGVTILRGTGVSGIATEDNDSITVEAGETQTFRGKWLVGCDGGRSVVRKAARFDFVGTEPKFTGYAVHCDLDHPNKLKPGFNHTKNGMYIRAPNMVYLTDFDGGAFGRTQEITQEHIQSILSRVSGVHDVKITKMHLALSFTDRCKQATSYRKGRVILAGDAAHIHGPLGGQGLSTGLGDAINLGWKLASTVRQESKSDGAPADLSLLDTYKSEREPVGIWALEWTRAQVAILQPDPWNAAIQRLVRDLINTTDGANLFIARSWGLAHRYNLGEGEAFAHPLVGCSVPDFELPDGSRLGPKLYGAKGLLVDLEDDAALKELIAGGQYETRVEYVGIGVKDTRGLRALLVRPDGVVAWVAEDNAKPDMDAAKAALEQWFEF